jgi:anti-sigma factor RsiW
VNCTRARRLLSAYLDSGLDATTTFEIARHLEQCAGCAARFTAEERVERAIAGALGEPAGGELALTRRALDRAVRRSSRRLWFLAAAAGLALVAGAVYALGGLRATSPPEIVLAAAEDHARWLQGAVEPGFRSARAEDVERFLSESLPGSATTVPRAEPWTILGVRLCKLREARVGFVMLHRGALPVSLFVIPRAELAEHGLQETDPGRPHCFELREGHAVLARSGEHLLCAVGDLPVSELEELVHRAR